MRLSSSCFTANRSVLTACSSVLRSALVTSSAIMKSRGFRMRLGLILGHAVFAQPLGVSQTVESVDHRDYPLNHALRTGSGEQREDIRVKSKQTGFGPLTNA